MAALILLALGLGVALTAYELSPRVHSRVDAYARALRAAHAAHQEADVHLSNAGTATAVAEHHAERAQELPRPQAPPRPAPPPVASPPVVQAPVVPPSPPSVPPVQPPPAQPPVQAPPPSPAPTPTAPPVPTAPTAPPQPPFPPPAPTVPTDTTGAHADAAKTAGDAAADHVAAATEANRNAAQQTAEAAKNAQTQAEKQAAAQSAAKVLEREKQIDDALARLGIGKCGVHVYSAITPQRRDMLITRLRTAGMTVTGDNPWNIDTNMSGVKLRAVWDPRKNVLRLIVNDWGTLAEIAGCDVVWGKIDTRLKEVLGS